MVVHAPALVRRRHLLVGLALPFEEFRVRKTGQRKNLANMTVQPASIGLCGRVLNRDIYFVNRVLHTAHTMIEWITFESKKIRGFPMGDPHVRSFPVYLPPGYSKKPPKPYLVFFMLAGYTGKGSTYLTDDTVFNTPLPVRFDRAIEEGRLPPSIIVFPDCTSKHGCSQYVNSPALGNYMDYLCDELVPLIDERYPTYRSADHRGIAGHSSGGFGAMVTALLRPGVFHHICSSAGDSAFEICLPKGVNSAMIELQSAGGVEKFIRTFFEHPSPKNASATTIGCMELIQYASCYAPNLNAPPAFGDLFFDPLTGAIRPEIWKKYLDWDPVHMLDRYESNIKKMKFILLEAGLQDEFALQWGHRQIAAKLKHLGVPHEINEYPGTHSGHHWRFESRFVRMAKAMT